MPELETYGAIIVGAGHGGSQVAATLRQEGYDKPILLVGRETEFPYHRPPLSKAYLKGAEDRHQPLRADAFYADNSIEFAAGRSVEAIDAEAHRVTLNDGSSAAFEKLVLATGAIPRWPELPGNRLAGILALRNIEDARSIRVRLHEIAHVAVVGGGFVGLEIAATLASLGKTVTVFELGPRLLGRAVSPLISEHVGRRLADSGVRIELETSITEILGETTVRAVRTTGGEELPADLVIFGIGVTPDTTLAEQAGLSCSDGILVDEAMRSSHPDILAIGDCARYDHWRAKRAVRVESVQNATDQARAAARTILGRAESYRAVPWFWSDIGDMKLQMVGLSFDADRFVVTGSPAENAFSVYHFAGNHLVAIDSINKPADHMMGRKILASDFEPDPELVETGTLNQTFKAWEAEGSAPLAKRA